MSHSQKILNLLGVGLHSELAQKVVAAGFSLTKLRAVPKQELIQHFDGHEVELIWKVVKRKPIPPDTLQRLVEECGWKCCACWNYQEDPPIIIHHAETCCTFWLVIPASDYTAFSALCLAVGVFSC